MEEALGILLRNAEPKLVSGFLGKFSAPVFARPPKKKDRTKASSEYLAALAENDRLLATLKFEAGRVHDLSKSHLDRYFRTHLSEEARESIEPLNTRDRSLWAYLNEIESFEAIEDELSYDTLSGARDKKTKFETEENCEFTASPDALAAFEEKVRDIYSAHDGSGRFVNTTPPEENFDEATLSLRVSRPLSNEEHFDEQGETHDQSVRRVTDVHIRYQAETGELFVVTSRGGFKVRELLAGAFAELILGVDETPTVSKQEELKLETVLSVTEPPPITGQPDAEIKLVEVRVLHPLFYGHRFEIACNDGLRDDLFKSLFGEASDRVRVLSVKFRIENYLPEGATKQCTLAVTLNRDGSVSCPNHKAEQERLIRILPAVWGLTTNEGATEA